MIGRTRGVRSWAILRASLRTIKNEPRLLVFPLLWGLGALMAAAVAIFLVALLHGVTDVELGSRRYSIHTGVVVGTIVAYSMGVTWLIFAVALSRAAMESMAGRTWSVGSCLSHALGRLPAIAFVTLANVFVRRLLQKGKDKGRLRRLGASVLELSWWAATYLVVPVLAREARGGLDSIIQSTKLFRETWREAFVGRLALGWIWVLVAIGTVGSVGVAHLLGIHDGRALWIVLGVPALFSLLLVLGVRTLDHVYRSALYVFATEGVVPGPFDEPDLHEIWTVPGPVVDVVAEDSSES